MKQHTFLTIATVIFALIALLHGLRILNGWSALLGSVAVPMWVSWISLVIAGYLAWSGFQLRKRS